MTTLQAVLFLVAGVCGVIDQIPDKVAWVLVGVVGALALLHVV